MDQGGYTATWQPAGLPSGMYFVTMTADGVESGRRFTSSMKIQVIR
jgi:hypothetical protein